MENNVPADQWGYVEVWLPDEIYWRTYPPLSYSTDDRETWSDFGSVAGGHETIKTYRGVDVNWVIGSGWVGGEPNAWVYTYPYTKGAGGQFELPESVIDSGGGQRRLLFGVFLPEGDKVLIRLGISIYYARPLKVTYVFRDSDDASFGLRNLEKNLVAYYDYATSEFIGGFSSTNRFVSLNVTQNENGKIESLLVSIPADTTFSLLSGKGIDTTVDANGDGIPDRVYEMRPPD